MLISFKIDRAGHAHEFLQRLDFSFFGKNLVLLLAGFSVMFEVADSAQADLNFVVNVFGD